MAQKGYTIIASDFYAYNSKYEYKITNSKLFRRFFALRNYFKSKKENEALVSTTTIKNYKATAKIALELFGEERKLFFITDNISFDDIKSITEAWPVNTLNFFSLNKISEYKSSGFGFVEQTDILVAKKLGLSKDSTFFIPRYVALKSDEEIKLANDRVAAIENSLESRLGVSMDAEYNIAVKAAKGLTFEVNGNMI